MEVLGFLDLEPSKDIEILPNLVACSWVNDSPKTYFLQSQNATEEVMAMYTDNEHKLHKVLKDISLNDHDWCLKSYNRYNKLVIVFNCQECKDFGGIDNQHSKERVSNLFSNFRKSHVMSNQLIWSWCLQKDLDWCNYPQSVAKGEKLWCSQQKITRG